MMLVRNVQQMSCTRAALIQRLVAACCALGLSAVINQLMWGNGVCVCQGSLQTSESARSSCFGCLKQCVFVAFVSLQTPKERVMAIHHGEPGQVPVFLLVHVWSAISSEGTVAWGCDWLKCV